MAKTSLAKTSLHTHMAVARLPGVS